MRGASSARSAGDERSLVRLESLAEDGFKADITYDAEGFVLEYLGIGTRIERRPASMRAASFASDGRPPSSLSTGETLGGSSHLWVPFVMFDTAPDASSW